jgi:hypothetical protein
MHMALMTLIMTLILIITQISLDRDQDQDCTDPPIMRVWIACMRIRILTLAWSIALLGHGSGGAGGPAPPRRPPLVFLSPVCAVEPGSNSRDVTTAPGQRGGRRGVGRPGQRWGRRIGAESRGPAGAARRLLRGRAAARIGARAGVRAPRAPRRAPVAGTLRDTSHGLCPPQHARTEVEETQQKAHSHSGPLPPPSSFPLPLKDEAPRRAPRQEAVLPEP